MAYQTLIVETRGNVGLITLNRPKALNALNETLIDELTRAIDAMEADEEVGAVVLTGSEKAFAAGADIKEMASKTYIEALSGNFIASWQRLAETRKPTIAAVNGYALGGGCEIALMCDIVLAGDGAKFGLPEVTIGTIPGSGGTQRLARVVGKAKAMEMVLTGRNMTAEEAERSGLASRVVPAGDLVDEALRVGERIAHMSRPIVLLAKEAVNRAYETGLAEGLLFERRLFHSTFATEDQKEGMAAFVEKRQPDFKGR